LRVKKTARARKSTPHPITSPSAHGAESGVPLPHEWNVHPSSPCHAWLTGSHPGILLLGYPARATPTPIAPLGPRLRTSTSKYASAPSAAGEKSRVACTVPAGEPRAAHVTTISSPPCSSATVRHAARLAGSSPSGGAPPAGVPMAPLTSPPSPPPAAPSSS